MWCSPYRRPTSVRSSFGPCSLASHPAPSPLPEESVARAVLAADVEADATANPASPVESQKPERAKAKGGHRTGTGRLGAAAYAGATRVESWPAGVEIRLDGNALL